MCSGSLVTSCASVTSMVFNRGEHHCSPCGLSRLLPPPTLLSIHPFLLWSLYHSLPRGLISVISHRRDQVLSYLVSELYILVLSGLVTLYQLSCKSITSITTPKSGRCFQWVLQWNTAATILTILFWTCWTFLPGPLICLGWTTADPCKTIQGGRLH